MIELLKMFPALWGIIGIVIASAAFLIGNRYIFAWQRAATTNLVDTLKGQISALTSERDDYRSKLHTEREEHHACTLRIKELELRPDVTALFQASQDFYKAQSDVQSRQAAMMSEMIQAVRKHDSDVGERMKPVYDSLGAMGEGIKELLKRTEKLAV